MSLAAAFLVVDDDADVLKAAGLVLARAAAQVDSAASLARLGEAVRAKPYDALLLDMNFAIGDRSGRAGLEGLAVVRDADPALAVVLMTTYGGVGLAVQAIKHGAADFVLKPWRNEDLLAVMNTAAARTRDQRRSGQALNLDALERQAIARALALYDGNISQAAQALGLTRPALYRRMARHGL